MVNAEVVVLSGTPVNKAISIDRQTADGAAIVTNAYYTRRSVGGHEQAIIDASAARELAASGLASAIENRTAILSGRTTRLLEQSTEVSTDLDNMNTTIVAATSDLSGAQVTETAAIAAENACKDSVLDATVKPLREASDDLFYRVDSGYTGDIEARLREEYDRLGVILGIKKPSSPESTDSTDATHQTITDQLQALDEATEALIDATKERQEKETILNRQQQLETALVEATTPVLQNMSDHERAMNHFAHLLEKLTTITDMDETTMRKIRAILVTLWLVISEPRSKEYDDTAYVQYKKAASEIETEPKVCEEIEQ